MDATTRSTLLRRGFALEYVTLGWNVVGIVVLAFAAIAARSRGVRHPVRPPLTAPDD